MKTALQIVMGGEDAPAKCGWCGWMPPASSTFRLAYCTQEGSACPSCRDEHWNRHEPWGSWRDALSDVIYSEMAPEQAYDYVVSACSHFGLEASTSLISYACQQALADGAKKKRNARAEVRHAADRADQDDHFTWLKAGLRMKNPIDQIFVRGLATLPTSQAVAVAEQAYYLHRREMDERSRLRQAVSMADAFLAKRKCHPIYGRVTAVTTRAAVRKANPI